jgi:hypothetical protein
LRHTSANENPPKIKPAGSFAEVLISARALLLCESMNEMSYATGSTPPRGCIIIGYTNERVPRMIFPSLKRTGVFAPVTVVALFCISMTAIVRIQPAYAQTDQATGWLEGTVVNSAGEATSGRDLCRTNSFACDPVTIKVLGPSRVQTNTDRSLGGFFSIRDLKPGVYEVLVPLTYVGGKNDGVVYRPQHIHGVIIKPGTRTLLKIVGHEA